MKLSHVFAAVVLSLTQLALAAPAEKAGKAVAETMHREPIQHPYNGEDDNEEDDIDDATCEESKKHLIVAFPLWNTNTKDMVYSTVTAEIEQMERSGYVHYRRNADPGWKMFNK
ncbi:hypothetical protein HGRIS_000436 [Hohenbuehelia grisea]|uniref:Uncharacterized protein n=1 Tax=Hohenbuehelia grisea TaxID=104357 RepID=A0ABR3JR80_9AGAR